MVRTPLHDDARSSSSGPVPRWQVWTSAAILVLSIVIVPLTLLLDGGDAAPYEQYPTVSGIALATLLLAVPVLAGGLATAVRGSPGGYVAWLGALGFMVYAWTAFATMFPEPTVLLGQTALLTLSLFTFLGAAAGAPVDAFSSSLEGRLPSLPLFAVLVVSAVLIAVAWLVPLLTAIAEGGPVEPVLREATAPQILLVLELGVLAPAMLFVAHRTWIRRPWGYATVGSLLVTVAGVGIAALASEAAAYLADEPIDVLPTAVVGAVTIAAIAFTVLVLYKLGGQANSSGWDALGRA